MLTYDDKLPVPLFATNSKQVAEQYIRRYERAKNHRENFVPLFEECYEYALPQRESFYTESAGERRDDKIFDETAVVGVQEFASRLQAGLVPNFARWADFTAGSEIPTEQRDAINNELEEVTDYVFEVIQNSNFGQEVHESFMDLAIGTGVLHVEEGDSINPINFTALPLPHVVLDVGPDDRIDHVYRERDIRYSDIMVLYPKATINNRLQSVMTANPDGRTKVLEIICKDYSQMNEDAYFCVIFDINTKCMLKYETFKGTGSNPFICFRWSKDPGAIYGRGPLINALSAIKTTNLTVELILQNAQMNISGIYTYEDDGVVNPDNINLVPGALIPVAPNSRGLTPLAGAGKFDVAQLILSDMRQNIKKALYMESLGRPEGTPMSATEVSERMADLSRQIGSSFGRLQSEFVTPLLRRVIRILSKQGRIEIPKIDNREVTVISQSPLAQAQHQQDVAVVNNFNAILAQTFGPQILNMIVKQDEVARYMAEKLGLPEKLIRDPQEQQALVNELQNMAQQGNMPGNVMGNPTQQE